MYWLTLASFTTEFVVDTLAQGHSAEALCLLTSLEAFFSFILSA